MKPLSVRQEQKPEDEAQQWGGTTCWIVREKTGEVPMAAFNSERSAVNFVAERLRRRT